MAIKGNFKLFFRKKTTIVLISLVGIVILACGLWYLTKTPLFLVEPSIKPSETSGLTPLYDTTNEEVEFKVYAETWLAPVLLNDKNIGWGKSVFSKKVKLEPGNNKFYFKSKMLGDYSESTFNINRVVPTAKVEEYKDNIFEPMKVKSGEKYGSYISSGVISFCSSTDCAKMIESWKKANPDLKVDFPLTSQVVSDGNYWATFDGEAVVRVNYNLDVDRALIDIKDNYSLLRLPLREEDVTAKPNPHVEFGFTGDNFKRFKKSVSDLGLGKAGETEVRIGGIAYYGYIYQLVGGNQANFIEIVK